MPTTSSYKKKVRVMAVITIIVALLHHDFWFWNDQTLVMGFMPIGLLYHMLFSIASAVLWATTMKIAWPTHIEEWADEFDGPSASNPAALQGDKK